MYAALIALAIMVPVVLVGEITIWVGNASPVFEDFYGNTIEPSDGGSSKNNPTAFGSTIDFTATATDRNGDLYYLAICKSDSITPVDGEAPICDNGEWAMSESPATSGTETTLTYTAQLSDLAKNEW